MSWNSKLVSNGAHTLTAVARDAGGNQAISLPSTVTVNNPDMTVVSIKAPASGSLVSGSVTVLASATGAVVGVQFKLDGVNLGSEITTAPYSMTWNTAGVLTGNHILTAVARDSAGIQTTSPGILVTAGTSPPIGPRITINSPNSDAVVAGSTIVSINVTGSAPAASAQIAIDGVKYGPEMTQEPFSLTWNSTKFSDGPHVLSALAKDSLGRQSIGSILVIVGNGGATDSITSSLMYSFLDQAGQLWTGGNMSAPMSVGYAEIESDGGANTPAGVAIFGFHAADGTLVSEARISALPLIPAGRMYVEVNVPVDTGVAFANPNDEDAVILFSFTDASGNSYGQGSFILGANKQLAAFLNEAPFSGPNSMIGTFTFTSTIGVSAIALRGLRNERGEFVMTTLPIADTAASQENSSVVLPHFAAGGGWSTKVVLVNPTDSTITGSIEFRAPGVGASVGSPLVMTVNDQRGSKFDYSIPPLGVSTMNVTSTDSVITTGSVTIEANAGQLPSGLAIFSSFWNGATVSEASVPIEEETSAFRIYVESSEAIQTGIAFANPSDASIMIHLELTPSDGTGAPVTGFVTIPAHGQVAKFVKELLPDAPATFNGLLRITSPIPIAAIGLRGTVNGRGDFLITTTPPTPEASGFANAELLFPHIVQGGCFTTEFVIFNREVGQSSGQIMFFSKDSRPLQWQ